VKTLIEILQEKAPAWQKEIQVALNAENSLNAGQTVVLKIEAMIKQVQLVEIEVNIKHQPEVCNDLLNLHFSVRARRGIERAYPGKVKTLGDLVQSDPKLLQGVRNFGATTYNEIWGILDQKGILTPLWRELPPHQFDP
jgi:DNA-directed RNA polymerase alpha subunit